MLYDNQQNFVTLDKEMDFIRNYIELMRIRLSANVRVETKLDVRPDSRTEIAPLIFISLIENDFKHGISPTEPSFIRIHFLSLIHIYTSSLRLLQTRQPAPSRTARYGRTY